MRNTPENILLGSSGMWFRYNDTDSGISLHRNKSRCGVLSRLLLASCIAFHSACRDFERCL